MGLPSPPQGRAKHKYREKIGSEDCKMKFIELESERLIYRKFKHEDLPVVLGWLGDADVMKYFSWEPKSESETVEYLNFVIGKAEEEECQFFEYAVVLKTDNTLIGSIALFNLPDNPEIGWTLHRDYWGQGYGTEMGKTLLKLGFETLGLHRIIASCDAENCGSYKIMEKTGMRREAHFVKARQGNSVLNHGWRDQFQYAILAEEYFAAGTREAQQKGD